jgi:hypothetical protein
MIFVDCADLSALWSAATSRRETRGYVAPSGLKRLFGIANRGVAPGYFLSRLQREDAVGLRFVLARVWSRQVATYGSGNELPHSTKNSTNLHSAQKRSSPELDDTNATWPPRSVAINKT